MSSIEQTTLTTDCYKVFVNGIELMFRTTIVVKSSEIFTRAIRTQESAATATVKNSDYLNYREKGKYLPADTVQPHYVTSFLERCKMVDPQIAIDQPMPQKAFPLETKITFTYSRVDDPKKLITRVYHQVFQVPPQITKIAAELIKKAEASTNSPLGSPTTAAATTAAAATK